MSEIEITIQNPKNPAPREILDSLDILEVQYFGYDGQIYSGQIVMNKNVIEDVRKFFDMALEIKFPIEKVVPISNEKYAWDDELSCEDNNSSGFNYRVIAGTNKLSKHASGLAFDINPAQNIYIRYDENMNEIARSPKDGVYDEKAKGTLTKDHPLVTLMKGLGWTWGGDWKSPVDWQHFEKNN